MKPEAHVAEEKKKIVKEFEELLQQYPIIGVLNMENMPTKQLQQMRAGLRGKALIRMTKQRLLKVAFANVKDKVKGIERLEKEMTGMPALLFTKDNPFVLAKTIAKSRTPAPAKAGQTAPKDIIVPAGPTGFAPGPIIGELGSAGIKAGIEDGKVAIKADSLVAKKGDVIDANLAGLLTRLNIQPMEIGLDLVAVLEDGEIFGKDILSVDEKEYLDKLAMAGAWAFNLAMDAAILTYETTELLISKAYNDAKALAISEGILADGVAEDILAKAQNEALSVASESKFEISS